MLIPNMKAYVAKAKSKAPDVFAKSIECAEVSKVSRRTNGILKFEAVDKASGAKFTALTYFPLEVKKGMKVALAGHFDATRAANGDYDFWANKVSVDFSKTYPWLSSFSAGNETLLNALASRGVNPYSTSAAIKALVRLGHPAAAAREFVESFVAQDVVARLVLAGLDEKVVRCLYLDLREDAFDAVKDDPYSICHRFSIPVADMDEVAARVGYRCFDAEDFKRNVALALEVMREARDVGMSALEWTEIIERMSGKPGFQPISNPDALFRIMSAKKHIVSMGSSWCLREVWNTEKALFDEISTRIAPTAYPDVENAILTGLNEFEDESKISLVPVQRAAVANSVKNRLSIITGGPGTGKTTIQRAIYRILLKFHSADDILFLAPTGIAAKNISSSTGARASTIHSALGYNPYRGSEDAGDYEFHVGNKMHYKVIVVDEMSMVSSRLMKALFAGALRSAHVILVGDANQLFSIEYGQVLGDMIDSEKVPTVALDQGFRFGGTIKSNAAAALAGSTDFDFSKEDSAFVETLSEGGKLEQELNATPKEERKGKEFATKNYLLSKEYEKIWNDASRDIVSGFLAQGFKLEQIKVLTPFNAHFFGTEATNSTLRQQFSSDANSETKFSAGDMVVNTLNNKKLGIMNGDTGIVVDVWTEKGQRGWRTHYLFDFNGIEVKTADAAILNHIKHSYAMTIHKAQGSGFDCVIIPIFREGLAFWDRRLLYTAISRAKKRLVFVGKRACLDKVSRDQLSKRTSMLRKLGQVSKTVAF